MAANLFKLVGSIYVDTDKANDSLSKTDKKAEGVGNKLAGAGKKAAAFAGAAVAATGAVVAGMKEQADATAAAADEIDKGSQKMGVSAEQYQKLSYAAELSGTSIGTLQKATQQLQKAGSDLDISGALDQLYAIEDADERAAAAHEMFGDKIANELAPMLNSGKDGFEAMTAEAEKLGLVMSDDAVKAGASYNDTMTALNKSMDALKNTLGTAMIPIFQTVADIILDNMPLIQDMMRQLAPILADMLKELAPMIGDLMPLIIEILPTVIDLAKAVIPPVMEIAKTVLPYLINVLNSFMPVIQGIIDFITGVFSGDWEKAWNGIVNIFSGIWDTMKAIFTKPINFIIDKLNEFIKYLNNIQIPDWVPGVGGKGLNLQPIPKLARGISRVPRDNYPALLHEGERVLTREEAEDYSRYGKDQFKVVAGDVCNAEGNALGYGTDIWGITMMIYDALQAYRQDFFGAFYHDYKIGPYIGDIHKFTILIDQDLAVVMDELKEIKEYLKGGKMKSKVEVTNTREIAKAVSGT